MWSQYDEDLSQNEFFKQIKENHADILKRASEERWVICVPRRGILKSEDFSMHLILDHVLIPNGEDRYTTMNKKDVQLDKRCLKLDQNNIFHSDVEVLFEETHYIDKSVKFVVWCVNLPLFLRKTRKHSQTPIVLTSIQDCIDFLYSEAFGRNLLESIQNLCLEFWTSHDNEEFEMETLQSQKDCIGNLYSQCLQLCFKTDIIRDKCQKNINYLDNFKLSIETYMQYCLGKKLIYSVNTLEHFTDSIVNKIIRNSFDVGLEDLNISLGLKELIVDAKYEASRINNFITVLDKVNCLSRIFNIFNNKTLTDNQTFYITSDDYLQILVYLIIKSNNPNWVANLTYIKEFQFADNNAQTNFFIVNLEAALAFIKSHEFDNIKKPPNYCDNTIFSRLYFEFKNTRSVAELYKIMKTEKEKVNTQLCHPLCLCHKCETVRSKKFDIKPYKILNNLNQNFLIIASMENQLSFLQFLLTFDYDVNCQDDSGKTALHYAAEKGLQGVLMLLINAKANVNLLDADKNTALHLACDRGHDSCVKALIYSSHFVEINLQNISGETPLFLATRWGFFDIIKLLLENGASVCIKNNRSLSIYKLSHNLYVTKLFKQFGQKKSNNIIEEVIKDSSKTQDNIILNISEACSNKLLTGLLQQGLTLGTSTKSPNDSKKLDLLFKAIINNDLPLGCFYLGYNSNTSHYDNTKCHPLCTCNKCSNNNDDYEEASFKNINKFNVNMCNSEGFTALHLAAKYGRTEILRVLLDCGAYLNVCDNKTFHTPLHLAVLFQRVQTVKELLKCGNCNVDAQNVEGDTPLYYACVRNNLKIVECLLQNGADCHKKNCKELTVLQLCEKRNLFRVCRMLKESIGFPATAEVGETSSLGSGDYFDDDVNDFEFL